MSEENQNGFVKPENAVKFDRNDIKLSNIENLFYKNGENVTCVASGYLTGPNEFMQLLGFEPSWYMELKSTARLNPNDEYVEGIGEKVAQAKAESRLYRLQANDLKRRYEHLLDVIEALKPLVNNFLDKADGCVEHNERYIQRITSPEYLENYKKELEHNKVF